MRQEPDNKGVSAGGGGDKHKRKGEKGQCLRCTYEKYKAEQKCQVEERMCNTCGDRVHFGMSRMCRKKKRQ